MSYITLEVEINQGKIIPREPEKLPSNASGLLTILAATESLDLPSKIERKRVELPLIRCKPGSASINPTKEELDASFWEEGR